jgi:hypothetical protein
MGKGSLHLLQMRMLTSSHALVFGSLKRSLVSLPRFQDGQLVGDADVVGFDNVHRTLEFFSYPAGILIVVHDFLLSGELSCYFSSTYVLSARSIALWSERPVERCLMRNTQPPHLLVPTMRGNGINQRCTNDAQYSRRGPTQAIAWPRYGGRKSGWVEALREVS